jgi:hypothetical protein
MGVDYMPVWQVADANGSTLMPVNDINEARAVLDLPAQAAAFAKLPNPLTTFPRIGLYKGYTGSMDEGWTRLVFDTFQIPYSSVTDVAIRGGQLNYNAIVLPADSEKTIVEGLSADKYPAQYSGGISEAGVENLKRYVAGGGKLICFDDSCAMVIKRFGLPVRDALGGLKRSEFYDPGSIVRLDVDSRQPLARGLAPEAAAYFTTSSAFDLEKDAKDAVIVARYGPLLSGWTLGEKYRLGKAALIETRYGKGKIVLFGFRPQHRGQTWGTFPLIFNALEKEVK